MKICEKFIVEIEYDGDVYFCIIKFLQVKLIVGGNVY